MMTDDEKDSTLGWRYSDFLAGGVLDSIAGEPPVQVSVWRATGPSGPPATATSITRGLTARLARMLVGLWTDPGQIIIDTTNDIAVHAAATAGNRTYQPLQLTAPGKLPQQPITALAGKAGLVLLRWPPHTITTSEPDPSTVLALCQTLLTPDGHAIVILAPPTGILYRDIAASVIPAAHNAGLRYLQHLIVITGDQPHQAPDGIHADMLVFVLRRS